MFDLGMVLTLYPPPHRLSPDLTPRQVDVSAVSAAPAKVLTCKATATEPEPHQQPTKTRSEER
ncbi:MAG TPA: hypothetical protein VGE61_09100 [Glycomyces sp.]